MPTHIGFQQALQILHLNAHPNAKPSSPCLNLARSLVTPPIYRASFTYRQRERERERERRNLHSIPLRKKKDIQKRTLYLMASSFDSDLLRQLFEHIPETLA
jgi:hypothetical protein